MRKSIFPILSILVLSSIIRIWNLGNIPLGLSLSEISLGRFLPTPFLIRLPFAVLGVVSVYLFYLLVKEIFDDEKVSLISVFVLSILPWHVQESRVFSWGVIFFLVGEILFLLFIKFFKEGFEKFKNINLFLGMLFLVVCIFVPIRNLSFRVNDERLVVANNSPRLLSRIFINKLTENYRYRQDTFFTNLDIGNYFFVGHPRERAGLEEIQKLLLFMLPFIIFGIFEVKKEEAKYLIFWTAVSLFVLTLFNLQGSQTLILCLPFVILTSIGVVNFFEKTKKDMVLKIFLFLILLFAVFETLYFYNSYFSGFIESQYSPRRPIFLNLSGKMGEVKNKYGNNRFLINDRIGNPKNFLSFYFKDGIANCEFKTFDYHQEKGRDTIFVDVLPDDPVSNEPLYKDDGNYPTDIEVIDVLHDDRRRQNIVIYKIK